MKKSFFLVLVFISIVVLSIRFGSQPLSALLGYQVKAGLKVTSMPEATVFLNGKEVGNTPYQDENLQAGDYRVKLEVDKSSWEGSVNLSQGTLSVVNRELAETTASSSGEVLTLNPGKGVVITSSPSEAQVEIDGKDYGKTPLAVSDLSSGEHTFLINHDSFLKRSIRASLPENMLLSIDVNLAISEVDLGGITTPTVISPQKLVVKQTPTGFLRVRNKPSLNGEEVGKVSSGDNLLLLEELSGWDRVRLDNGTEGYISSSYVQKQSI